MLSDSHSSQRERTLVVDTWAATLSSANDAPVVEEAAGSAVRVLVVGVTPVAVVSLARSFLREGVRAWTTTQLEELPSLLAGGEWAYVMAEHSIEAIVREHLRSLRRDTPVERFATRPLDDWSTHVLPLDTAQITALQARHA
jgi:hypothetical protein